MNSLNRDGEKRKEECQKCREGVYIPETGMIAHHDGINDGGKCVCECHRNKDQYKEVDDRFDEEFVERHIWEETPLLYDTDFKEIKRLKDFLHSELEKVRQETIEMLADKVQENRKGTFTDDAGYDCWYIDDLVKFIKSLSINKKQQ